MSFLKKLFGGDETKDKVPRVPRVRVGALHHVSFRLQPSRSVGPVALANISTQGMGLLRKGLDSKAGSIIKGELEINQKSFAVEAEVRHQSDIIVGCKFVGPHDELSRAVEDYFKVEICALKLSPVDQAYLKQDPQGKIYWYTDGRQNEVYLVADNAGIVNFHLSFLGNYIEGGRKQVLRAGHILSEERVHHRGSDLLQLSSDVSDEVLNLGKNLIENVAGLPHEQLFNLKTLLQKT